MSAPTVRISTGSSPTRENGWPAAGEAPTEIRILFYLGGKRAMHLQEFMT
jgi:hypothetical protein